MKRDVRTASPIAFIHLAGLFFVASALAVNPFQIADSFFSDEAVYYTMAHSFASDGDMEFRMSDLQQAYKESSGGPQGIILKMNERDRSIVFGKGYLYSLAAAPLVKILKTNGLFLLNALLLWLNLLCAYRFFSAIMSQLSSVLFTFFFFLANATVIYVYWMTPEYFAMSLVCCAFFFFTASTYLKSERKIFSYPYNFFIAAIFFALATFTKPPNALLILPIGIWLLLQKKIPAAMVTLAIYILVTLALFGINVYFTGDWNYQAGRRALFYNRFPFERPGVSEFAPFTIKPHIEAMVTPPFYVEAFLRNWVYFFFGRFSGMAIYFFPMFFSLLYFFFQKKNGLSVAVYLSGCLGILYYMVGLPWNYFGGSGTIGNRYLVNVFPVFLFTIQKEPDRRLLGAAFLISLLFTSCLLVTPVLSSFDVAFHQKKSLFRLLPVEQTLLMDLPTNNTPSARRVNFSQPANYFIYFMDANTYYKETLDDQTGFWVKGERTAEFVLRAFQPAQNLVVRLKSLKPQNRVSISINGEASEYSVTGTTFQEIKMDLPKPLPYDRDGTGPTYLYKIRIHARSGEIARFNSLEERYLGVFVALEVPYIQKQAIPPESS